MQSHENQDKGREILSLGLRHLQDLRVILNRILQVERNKQERLSNEIQQNTIEALDIAGPFVLEKLISDISDGLVILDNLLNAMNERKINLVYLVYMPALDVRKVVLL